jgi:hypothetical protein
MANQFKEILIIQIASLSIVGEKSYGSNADVMENNAVRWDLREIIDRFGQRSMECLIVRLKIRLQNGENTAIAESFAILR